MRSSSTPSLSSSSLIVAFAFTAAACQAGPGDPADELGTAAAAAQGPQQVVVTNAATSPVPTEAVGTTTIAGEVTIAATDQSPVPVRAIGPAAPIPWLAGGQIVIDPGDSFGHAVYPVPGDKRLVIDYVTVEASFPTGQTATFASILGTAAGEGQLFRFPLAPAGKQAPAFDTAMFAGPTSISVDVTAVSVTVARAETVGLGLANVALSGHLVDP